MEKLIKQIKERMTKAGFAYNEQTLVWSKKETHQQSGGTISINGKVMQQPPIITTIEMIVNDYGDCAVEDIKTGKIENSRIFGFEVWQNENLVQNFELNFYENEYNLFNDLLIKIFKI